MANTTTHDTVGASTLAVPYFSPASPTPDEQPPIDSPDRLPNPVSSPGARSPSGSPPASREASLDRATRELDARFREYTVDFSRFPSGHGPDDALDEQPEEEEPDRLSAVGGPEDFTANLERYLLGEDDSIDQELDDEDKDQEQPQEGLHSEPDLPQHEGDDLPERGGAQSHQPAVEEAEIGEDSEFGPVDMSTPSHLLRRTAGPTRDATHLEDIEEDPDDEPSLAATPTVRKQLKSPTNKETKDVDEDLRRQIAEMTQAIKDRDEQLEKNRKRVLEAASFADEIKLLRAELQRKTDLVEEIQESHADRVKSQQPSVNASDFSALQKQIADMQKDLQSRNSHADVDTERQETIAILHQQLSLTQEQLRKRDAVLDETLAQLKQVTAAKEQQLHEKNAEVDRLRSQVENQRAEIERLETDFSRANREYRVLEDQMVLLETKNQPLEERNSTLEADLTRAQSQVTAQENALKAMATDTPGGTYSEILELIKDLGQPNTHNRPFRPRDSGGDNSDQELEQIYEELAKLRTESSERAATNKSLEAQLSRAQDQAAESQLLIQSIEAENTRLTKQADNLKSTFDKTHDDLNHLRAEHAEALEMIERLQEAQQTRVQAQGHTHQQQPSPPSTPHTNINNINNTTTNNDTASLEATHKAQIANLKTAHATAISALRSAHADSTRKLRALLAASEKREADLRSELEQQDEENDQTTQTQTNANHEDNDLAKDDKIASLTAEITRLNAIITSKDETAAAMDVRIAKSVEKREKEWERRVELLLKERERMGKALLWTWGEKENPGLRSRGRDGEREDKDKDRSKGGKGKESVKGVAASSGSDKENVTVDESVGGRRHGQGQGQGQVYRYKYVKRT
ncbi:putative spindle pole body associated protein SnaD [Aspergillus undulatus]|uniref:putative spindle pole body associated protein SnaD n=1 Tax=Aspergillus undulatus TaxID=1810928 RepID=UPI003CCCEEAB